MLGPAVHQSLPAYQVLCAAEVLFMISTTYQHHVVWRLHFSRRQTLHCRLCETRLPAAAASVLHPAPNSQARATPAGPPLSVRQRTVDVDDNSDQHHHH